MKTTGSLAKFVSYALLIAFGLLGADVAVMTVQRYAVVVRAILGLAVVYLGTEKYLFSQSLRSEKRDDVHLLFEFPSNIKYFVLIFIMSLIGVWALMQIIIMVFFYING